LKVALNTINQQNQPTNLYHKNLLTENDKFWQIGNCFGQRMKKSLLTIKPGKSTIDAIFTLHVIITHTLLCFIDFRKRSVKL
jgi:hypothetical protein